jgi:hypothetical protein
MKHQPISKTCSCGRIHTAIPDNARKWIDEGLLLGFCWECECGSTLFKRVGEIVKSVNLVEKTEGEK